MSVFLLILKALIALAAIGGVVVGVVALIRHLRAGKGRPRRESRKERRKQGRKVKHDRRRGPRRTDDVAEDFLKKV